MYIVLYEINTDDDFKYSTDDELFHFAETNEEVIDLVKRKLQDILDTITGRDYIKDKIRDGIKNTSNDYEWWDDAGYYYEKDFGNQTIIIKANECLFDGNCGKTANKI